MVEARLMYLALLRLSRPAVVLDIGSCDGHEAKQFRRMVPQARVIAFEADERNYTAMMADASLAGIEIRRQAVSDHDGEATFYELDRPDRHHWARGASSLRHRGPGIAAGLTETPRTVPSVRVDSVLAPTDRAALWIDVEGALDLVLAGAEGARGVFMIHTEVETVPMWTGEADAATITSGLRAAGFAEVARDRSAAAPGQDNVLFCRGVSRGKILAARAAAWAYPRVRRVSWAARRRVRPSLPSRRLRSRP